MSKVWWRAERAVSVVETCLVIPLLFLAVIASIGFAHFGHVWSKLNSMTAFAAVTFRSTMLSADVLDSSKVPTYKQLAHNPEGDAGLLAKQQEWYAKKKKTGLGLNSKGELEPKVAKFLNNAMGIFMVSNPDMTFPPAVETSGAKVKTIWSGGAYEVKVTPPATTIVTSITLPAVLTMSAKSEIFEQAIRLFSPGSSEPVITSAAILNGISGTDFNDVSGITVPFLGFETQVGKVVISSSLVSGGSSDSQGGLGK